jgi:hypothetical protein
MDLGGKYVRKDIGGGGPEWVVLKTDLEVLLAKERVAKFTLKGGLKFEPKPTKGNGKKPSNRPTGG